MHERVGFSGQAATVLELKDVPSILPEPPHKVMEIELLEQSIEPSPYVVRQKPPLLPLEEVEESSPQAVNAIAMPNAAAIIIIFFIVISYDIFCEK